MTESEIILEGENKVIRGNIFNSSNLRDLSVYYLSSNGQRVDFKIYSVDKKKNLLNIGLQDDQILKTDHKTDVDRMLAMGKEPPSFANSLRTYSDPTVIGRVWFEMIEEPTSAVVQKINYTHRLLPVRKGDLLSSKKNLDLTSTIKLSEVGFTRIKIVDETGDPIDGAKVVSVVEGRTKDSKQQASEMASYRPRAFLSNNKGEVSLFPLAVGDNFVNFKVVVYKEGYCTFSNPLESLIFDRLEPYSVMLKKCEGVNKKGDFLISYEDDVHVESMNNNIQVGYTKRKNIQIRLDALSNSLRAVEVSVLEGHDETVLPNQAPQKIDFFTSVVDVDLPDIFLNGQKNGDFLIKVVSIPVDPSEPQNVKYLWGRKNIERPESLPIKDSTKVVSSNGKVGYISAIDGQTFKVRSEGCKDNYYLGVSIDQNTKIYKRCKGEEAVFNISDFTFEIDGVIQQKTLRLFYKTLNGVESEDEGNNHIEVWVDNLKPDIKVEDGKVKFSGGGPQVFFGIEKPGVDFAFDYTGSSEEDTLIISPDTVDQFVFRFQDPPNCTADDKSIEDGFSPTGQEIKMFSIFSTAGPERWEDCSKDDGSNSVHEFPLDSRSITFPVEATESASYQIAVQDRAGNQSDSVTVNIPPCPANYTGNTTICWKPDEQ